LSFASRSTTFVNAASTAVDSSLITTDTDSCLTISILNLNGTSLFGTQGAGCYNPCLRTYRACQRKSGRYNKTCRQRFASCWKECNKAVGYNNPMPKP
jgi:hypothetical protein